MTETSKVQPAYSADRTALLLVDPYNDFLAEGGKLWPLIAAVATRVSLHTRLRAIVAAARSAGISILIVPHHRAEAGDFSGWDHPTPYQLAGAEAQAFAKDTWGGQWHEDFVPQLGDGIVKEHWSSNGFANTDLDLLLKQKSIRNVVLVGLVANTCIEGTARAAVDLGYHTTLVTDATAAFSEEAMHAAHGINAPHFAHAILSTQDVLDEFSKSAKPRSES